MQDQSQTEAEKEAALREAGRLLFAGSADFFYAADKLEILPPMRGTRSPSRAGPTSASRA